MPKKGFISASIAKAVLTKGTKGNPYGATFMTGAQRVGAQMVGYDVSANLDHIAHIKHGNEYEPYAIEAYESNTMQAVHGQQKWVQSECGRFGCHPDGLVGTDGMIEVKCPKPHNHLDNVLNNAQLSIYLPQMQFSLMVTGRKWCDLISYDLDAPIGIDLHVVRVERDDAMIADLVLRSAYMHQLATKIATQLEEKINARK
jgi:hypothetical protein